MQQCQLSLEIDTTNAAVPLGVEVWINHTLLLDVDHVDHVHPIIHVMEDAEQQHELRVVLKNKLPEHTTIDQQQNIVSDARLVIRNVTFDQIRLDQILVDQAIYSHDHNGSGVIVQEKFYGEMGCNGTVSLQFTTPMYVWLLQNM
jgi:hypothetical protein